MPAPICVNDQATLEYIYSKCIRVEETDCLLWQGGCTETGYGKIAILGRQVYVHRELFRIKSGRTKPLGRFELVCHTCDIPNCCEYGHLFLGDDRTNAIDKARKGRLVQRGLTPEEVREIREIYGPPRGRGVNQFSGDEITYEQLASMYGTNPSTIGFIVRGAYYPEEALDL